MLSIALFAAPASALDFDDLVESWTFTIDGQPTSEVSDEASGVAIDALGNVTVVGWLDGLPGHDHDGYAVQYAPDGSVLWELFQDVGEIGVDRTSSEDRLYDVAVEPLTDAPVLCGGRGPALLTDAPVRYLVETYDAPIAPYAPVLAWNPVEYVDGNAATSPNQECRGVDRRGGYVYAAGWADHGADAGRWYSMRLDEVTGVVGIAPFTYDAAQYPAVPDQAYGVAASAATGVMAIVGARGFSGLPGSDLNDTDWHVQYFDPYGALLWEHTYAGGQFLDDRAMAVALDTLTGDIVVVGWTNVGDDNAAGADLDWLMIRYDGAGDGSGGPVILWSQTWESATGGSEGATAVAFDDLGDVLVGGWAVDPATGVDHWRVGKYAFYDGLELQEWLGTVHPGDSRIADLDQRGSKVAMVGYVDTGSGRDFAATVLEGDQDGDGYGDSVDVCPSDAFKWDDEGVCGCGISDDDTDGDGVEGCIDACPSDPTKSADEGACGCGTPDVDSDGDATADCDDRCPDDPYKALDVGVCGCNAPDSDTDGDGVLGCDDACANTPPDVRVNEFGCPIEDGTNGTGTGTGGTGTGTGDTKAGCSCASGPGAAPIVLGAWLVALVSRRRVRYR